MIYGIIRAIVKIFAGVTSYYHMASDQSPQSQGKKQVCLDCNGAVASPALLQMIPHVLLASTWQTNLKRIANAVELFNTHYLSIRTKDK